MATTEVVDLSSVVLLFGNVVGTDKILELSDNSRFEFQPLKDNDNGLANWMGKQSDELAAPFLSLVFGKNMFSPLGWVFGSSDDTDKCDFQLAKDNTTGVSGQHFRIDLSPDTHRPRLTALSGNPIHIHIDGRTIILHRGQALEIASAVTIDLGEVRVRAWRPILSYEEEQRYRRNSETSSQEYLNALQKIPEKPNFSGASTFDLRFGRNDSVYKRVQAATTGTGSFASVMKVMEIHSQKIFAAKVPHFKSRDPPSVVRKRWELLTEEFQQFVKLRHQHIVQAIEVIAGHGNNPPWLIMEWIDYDLNSINLDDHHVPTILTQISKGLAYMHTNSFTHRDLKPGNILIQLNRGRLVAAKIADFGTMKYDVSGKMQTYHGTSVYVAPEFWEEELAYTNAVDMWSFGIIAVQLFTRWEMSSDGWDSRFPPSQAQHQKWIGGVLRQRVAGAPDIFKPLLLGLLSETPNSRWTAIKSEEWLQENAHVDASTL